MGECEREKVVQLLLRKVLCGRTTCVTWIRDEGERGGMRKNVTKKGDRECTSVSIFAAKREAKALKYPPSIKFAEEKVQESLLRKQAS